MKKSTKLITLLLLICLNASSVLASNRMNMALLRAYEKNPASTHRMHVLVQGDIASIREWCEKGHAEFKNNAGDVAWLYVPINEFYEMNQVPFVRRIEAFPNHTEAMNDTMRYLCQVDEAHQGLQPLTNGLKGSGVVIGYIDSGIDLLHPDFRDVNGHTRVKCLWDTKLPNSPRTPQPWGYGQEFTGSQIDSGLAAAHTGTDEYGHGTYVAGIGSGNGRSVGRLQGVAPASDIIVVNYDFTAVDTLPRYAHAVDYIFQRAAQLNKPCVINASLGDYYGSHDGRDLQSLYISNLISAQSGRVLVAAAGNVGVVYPFHVGHYPVAGDTSFTWFKYNPNYAGAYMQIFGDSADLTNVRFAIGADKVTPYFEFRGNTGFMSIDSMATSGGMIPGNFISNSSRLGQYQMLVTNLGGTYSLEIFVQPDSTDYQWRFMTTGNGHFDGWTFDWVFQNLPNASTFPDITHYVAPDTLQSIVSGFACLDNVITVGNYFNTDRHVDVTGTLQISPNDLPRQLAANSSRGPTRDGRIKPDICAPGHHIISTGVLSLLPGLISGFPYKVDVDSFHITGGGTSASAPVVAGIAALYLQQNPGADWQDVEQAIYSCAQQDMYTWGPYPNNAWGYGKAVAFPTLTNCSPSAIQSIEESAGFRLYPNPSSDQVRLDFEFPVHGRLVVFTIDGREILETEITGQSSILSTATWEEGLYMIRWSDGTRSGSKTLAVMHR